MFICFSVCSNNPSSFKGVILVFSILPVCIIEVLFHLVRSPISLYTLRDLIVVSFSSLTQPCTSFLFQARGKGDAIPVQPRGCREVKPIASCSPHLLHPVPPALCSPRTHRVEMPFHRPLNFQHYSQLQHVVRRDAPGGSIFFVLLHLTLMHFLPFDVPFDA